jgi:hypothetical protein
MLANHEVLYAAAMSALTILVLILIYELFRRRKISNEVRIRPLDISASELSRLAAQLRTAPL